MKLFLIGYRGTGKTKVAEILAASRHWDWADSDVEIERRAGKSIALIFSQDGEAKFRQLECEVVRDLAKGQPRVVSLGGGAVMQEENRQVIAARGWTCWLQAAGSPASRQCCCPSVRVQRLIGAASNPISGALSRQV